MAEAWQARKANPCLSKSTNSEYQFCSTTQQKIPPKLFLHSQVQSVEVAEYSYRIQDSCIHSIPEEFSLIERHAVLAGF